MNVHGVGPSPHISQTAIERKPSQPVGQSSSPADTPAATADISDEAKALSQRSGRANPHQVAEALGAKNFGQALKSLREAGVELDSGFVSDLVHGDEEALAAAQAALAPPEPEVGETEESSATDSVPEPAASEDTPPTEPLVVDFSETNLELPEAVVPPQDDASLLETLLDATTPEEEGTGA